MKKVLIVLVFIIVFASTSIAFIADITYYPVSFASVLVKTVLKPVSVEQFAKVTVMITNLGKTSGGSGSVLKSDKTESVILTNEHICALIKTGGLVNRAGVDYTILSYKVYAFHDLCLIKVLENLDVNLSISESSPTLYSDAVITGHPALLPLVVTKGHFSTLKNIDVVVGLTPCDKDTPQQYELYCIFMGGVPIIQTYRTQLVSSTILPGSSGSAVFNSAGEISGVVFASMSRELSYAFIVPQSFVRHFLETQNSYNWVNVIQNQSKPSGNKQQFKNLLYEAPYAF